MCLARRVGVSLFLVAPLSVTSPFHSYSQDSSATDSASDCGLRVDTKRGDGQKYVLNRKVCGPWN